MRLKKASSQRTRAPKSAALVGDPVSRVALMGKRESRPSRRRARASRRGLRDRQALPEQPRRVAAEDLCLLLRRQAERIDVGGVRDNERIVGAEQDTVLADLADRHLDERFGERASVVIEVTAREHAWRLCDVLAAFVKERKS